MCVASVGSMSNPLIRPGDPRFQKPSIVDAQGQNRFGEGQPAEESGDSSPGDAFAAGQAGEERPYQPQYEATQKSRSGVLLLIASLGILGAVFGIVALLN